MRSSIHPRFFVWLNWCGIGLVITVTRISSAASLTIGDAVQDRPANDGASGSIFVLPDLARYNFSDYKFITLTNSSKFFFNLSANPYEKTNLLLNPPALTAQSNYNALVMRLGNYQSALAPPPLTSFASTNGQFTITLHRSSNLSYALDDLAWASGQKSVSSIVQNDEERVARTGRVLTV